MEYQELSKYALRSEDGALFVYVMDKDSDTSFWVEAIKGGPCRGSGIVISYYGRDTGPAPGKLVRYSSSTASSQPSLVLGSNVKKEGSS